MSELNTFLVCHFPRVRKANRYVQDDLTFPVVVSLLQFFEIESLELRLIFLSSMLLEVFMHKLEKELIDFWIQLNKVHLIKDQLFFAVLFKANVFVVFEQFRA